MEQLEHRDGALTSNAPAPAGAAEVLAGDPVPQGDHGATPTRTRKWATSVLVGGAVITAAALGAAAGFLVADDSNTVEELETAQRAAEDDLADLEDDLEAERESLASVQDDMVSAQEDMDDCLQASRASAALVAAVDELAAADADFQATPVGSPEEAAALAVVDSKFTQLVGSSAAADLSVDRCLEHREA
jgi:hypothetical protein